MKVGKTSLYGLFAVIYIARNGHDRVLQGRDIAKAYGIPVEYLLKILQLLVRAGLLRSERGRLGGFGLARDPSEITLQEISEALESDADLSVLLRSAVKGHGGIKHKLLALQNEIEEKIQLRLSQVTIAELVKIDDDRSDS